MLADFERSANGMAGRAVSCGLSLAAAVVLALKPLVLGDLASVPDRIALAVVLVGMVGGIAHGAGQKSERRVLRWTAHPAVAWPAMGLGALWLLAA
jgi:hypothetical protein